MEFPGINKLGDFNPQLLRELKGRLKQRNVIIAAAISLLGQFLLLQYFQSLIPKAPETGEYTYKIYKHLCTGASNGSYNGKEFECIRDTYGNFVINWQQWWLNVFVILSVLAIGVLLVAGSYMLIADLAKEERQGTLNFIRLSPESTEKLLVGKLLGTPILLYLLVGLAVPLHLWAGLSAQVPLWEILGFYAVAIAFCVCFFSASLLYGLVTSWLAGFQAWLASGSLAFFAFLVYALTYNSPIDTPLNWFRLFIPFDVIPSLTESSFYLYSTERELEKLQWFFLPIGSSLAILFCFYLLNYGLWNYWIWQGIKRRFRNQNATIFSKSQSYLLTACFAVSSLGFGLPGYRYDSQSNETWLNDHIAWFCCLNLVLFSFLIAALSPQRQSLQDWSRYRRERAFEVKKFWNTSLFQSLTWGEKSPALLAIALNLVIAITPLALFVITSNADSETKSNAFLSLALLASLVMCYAILAQVMLFAKTRNPEIWAIGAVGAAVVLPPVILGLLSINPESSLGFLWLFTVGAPIVPLYNLGSQLTMLTVCVGIIAQCSGLALLNFNFTRKLKKAGESETKALLSASNS